MILAVDVTYTEPGARVAGVLFESWDVATPSRQVVIHVDEVAEYEPGQFYKRELPCIASLIDHIDIPLDYIVIDGYVWLGSPERGGLGAHLYEHLRAQQRAMPVIGVAKSEFVGTPDETKVYRGDSSKPLFVTTAGIALDEAKAHIAAMHGKFRMPDLLKLVDGLSRGTVAVDAA
jgi:deoxyribonuclease V